MVYNSDVAAWPNEICTGLSIYVVRPCLYPYPGWLHMFVYGATDST